MASRSRKTKRQGVHPPSKRQALNKNEVVVCGDCAMTWRKDDKVRTYFVLPCQHQHQLCPLCFSSFMSVKGSMHYYNCPCCEGEDRKEKHTHWDVFSPQERKTRRGVELRQHRATHSLKPPDPNLNPVLCHHVKTIMNERRDEEPDFFTLNLTRTKKNKEGKATLHALSFPIPTKNLDATICNAIRKKMIAFFQLLHPVLVSSSKKIFQNQYECVSSDSESGKTLFDAASLDQTCLFQCIYALSTGRSPPSASEIASFRSTQRKNLVVQIFAIAEMIRSQCVLKGRSILKDFVGQQLMINCASQSLYRILNQLGISSSNETIRVDAIKDCKSKILAGYPLKGKKYDLFLILFDNLGFRVRGGKKS